MKRMVTYMALLMGCWPLTAFPQLQLRQAEKPPSVFGNGSREIAVIWHNGDEANLEKDIRARILQTSSATAVQVNEVFWKKLEILPQQTILESAFLDFPPVKAETKFLVQWSENTNQVIGTTEVWVYPTNLLAELKPLLNGEALGVLDPNNDLKPVLNQNGVKFLDLSQTALEDFSGRLAILGPFRSIAQIPDNMARRCKTMTTNGVAVLWILPTRSVHDSLQPSFYTVISGPHAIVIAQASLISCFSKNPSSQQHLLQLCKLALKPEPASLPEFTSQP